MSVLSVMGHRLRGYRNTDNQGVWAGNAVSQKMTIQGLRFKNPQLIRLNAVLPMAYGGSIPSGSVGGDPRWLRIADGRK